MKSVKLLKGLLARVSLLAVLLISAFVCYAMGARTGMVWVLLSGFLFESGFWLVLLKARKQLSY